MPDQPPECQVLVVGAGAAGSMLALELARHGVDVRVVDRLAQPASHSRAVTVHARTLELLERIDPALCDRFLAHGLCSPGYVLHFVDQAGVRRVVRPGLDFRRLRSRYPFLLLNPQDHTERLLRDYTRERYGVEPQWGFDCDRVELEVEGVRATLRTAAGAEEVVRCRYLVACDGVGSRVRQQLELTQDGSDYAGTVLQNLDVELDGFPDDAEWVHYCMGPGHFLMVVRLPPGFFRLLMSQPADQADPQATPKQAFADVLAQHFDGLRLGRTAWHSRWQSVNRLARRYRRGNVFLAGDAAHTHSTAGGQGMNCCMQDSVNLAWRLALVLQAGAGEGLLDDYEGERKPIAAQVIEAASQIHELFMAGRTSTPEHVLHLQRDGALSDLVGRVSGIAYHYRPAGRQADEGEWPQVGDRAPDAELPGGGSVYESLRHSGFTVLAALPPGVSPVETRGLLERIQAIRPELIRTALLAPAPAVYLGNSSVPLLYLIRPDAYVGARCRLEDGGSLEGSIDGFLR